MSHIVHVATAAPAFVPAPITDEEAAAGLRAAFGIFKRWNLTDAEAADLVDAAPRTLARWKAGSPARLGRDQRERLSNLLGIHKALRILFTDPQRAYAWVRTSNETFGGKAALDVMLAGGLPGIMRVRRYLDAARGG